MKSNDKYTKIYVQSIPIMTQPNIYNTHIFLTHKKYPISHHMGIASNISHNLVVNETVDHSDVLWASPVVAAPTTSSFSI